MTARSNREEQVIDLFVEFFEERYKSDILDLANNYPRDRRSLYVEFGDLYQWHITAKDAAKPDNNIADDWLSAPMTTRDLAEDALTRVSLPGGISAQDDADSRQFQSAHVRLTDSQGMIDRASIAGINSEEIGDYVALEADLEKVTGTGSRIDTAVFECQRCGHGTAVPQSGSDIQDPYECGGCERQGPFALDAEKTDFTDIRKLKLSEPPEERVDSTGLSFMALAEDDLCFHGGTNGLADHAGETVTVLGVVQPEDVDSLPDREPDKYLDARAVVFEDDEMADIEIDDHRDEIEALAAADDTVEQICASIVPDIDPDDDLMAAIEGSVAFLFGGYRVDPESGGGSYRGDIHMGLIGDPGKGKSSLAKRIHTISPKCEFRSGTALTKVGLTASAVQEEFDGSSEWVLEPGILPRSNGGHCIIDEVDAIMDDQTKAIHDALEGEQMLKVDKADIRADLPTRTGLMALGNPVDGSFDRRADLASQVDLDEALIDRMDLLFALTDEVDEIRDRSKADHVVNSYDELSREELHERGMAADPGERETTDQPVADDTLRAMIAYARENIYPTLTPEVKDRLTEFYVEVRNLNGGHDGEEGAKPATLRKLEAGIRLSTAYARANLSETVELEHAERAIKVSKQVIGLNYDPVSGEFDRNRTSRGTPKSQKDRRQRILELIDELDDGGTGGGAPIADVLDAAEEEGIGRSQAKHDIDKLGQDGHLHYPANKEVRTT